MKKSLMIIMVLAGLAMPAASSAQDGMPHGIVNMKNIEPLKNPAFLPQEEFEAKTQLIEGDPNNDPLIQYEVRLPSDWIKEKPTGAPGAKDIPTLSKNVVQRVARYVSPAQKQRRSFMTVESQELTYEIGAYNWFLNYLKATGVTPEMISPPNEDVAQAFYVALEGDRTYGVRIKTLINGPRVVIVRYFVPIELFKEERAMQAQSVESFKLTGKKVEQIEKRATHGFFDQAYFDYPVSWKLSAPDTVSVDRMRAMVYVPGAGGKLAGQINIYMTSRYIDTTLAKEVAQYREKFSLPDYKIGARIEDRTLTPHKDIEKAQTEIYKLEPQKNFMLDYELWVTVMQSEGYYYIITMITPARHAEFYQWARNVKAYEIVVATARQFDPEIDTYQYSE